MTLDHHGVVQSANQSAGAFWSTTADSLIGKPFVSLFAFEVVSDDPDMMEAQWDVLTATATAQRVPLAIQPDEESPATEVRLALETAVGHNVAWLATIELAPKTDRDSTATPGSPAGGATSSGAWEELARSDAAGFFDLNFLTGETHYSTAWKRMLGYPDADLSNDYDTWLKLIHPDDSAAAPDQVGRHTRSSRRTYSVELRMKHRRGHWMWIQSVGVQHFAADGELERVIGFHLDIAERKELEEQSVIAEDRLASLTEDGALAVFDLDFISGHAWTSLAWQDLVGDPVEHPDLGAFTRNFAKCHGDLTGFLSRFGGDEPWGGGYTVIKRSDRSEASVLLGLHRSSSRRGELTRVVGFAMIVPDGVASDSTSTRSAASGGVATSALNSLSEAVIITDEHGQITAMNVKAERFTGIPLAAATARRLDEVFNLVTLRDERPANDALDRALEVEGPPKLYTDHALAIEHGAPRPIVWTASQVRDDQQKAIGIIVVFRDPDEMTLSPEELIRANRFDSLGQLAGGIAHDFNNLLSTILGGISIAKENRDYGKLDDAETACMAAKTLTRQLLAFAKGNPGGTFSVVRPADILRDAVRVAASGSPVVVTVDLDENAGPIEVDRGQMIQVYQNLIINAMQAMPDPSVGKIHLTCRAISLPDGKLPPLAGGDYVQVDVQDNGSGIPEDKIDRIFEPFFTTKKTGTGLGLATVLSIVRKHGGQLGVDSTVGVGTTFTSFLPVTTKSIETGVRKPAALRFGTGRVLFMDDEKQLCEITKTMLESLDYKVDIVHRGEDALALYRKYHAVNRPYDVVLLDLTIVGGMGGEETFKRLREIDPEVRAIVSSGYDNDEMARQFLDSGFCGYLTKPYRVGELGQMLKGVLGG